MLFKLAWKNIKIKPFRAIAIIFAIAISIAMIFSMLSFKDAVYEYIYEIETTDAGNSDIKISYNSNGDRITSIEQLSEVDGIKQVFPTLKLYALLGDDYVQLKGIDFNDLSNFQEIKVLKGNLDDLKKSDNIAISDLAAKHYNLNIGSQINLKLGTNEANFFVAVIAQNSGYFLADSPFAFVGNVSEGVARLIEPSGLAVYNEIYIKANNSKDIKNLISQISSLRSYQNMKVGISKDSAYIQEQTTSLTAPIVLSGFAVFILSVACVGLLFLMSEKDKIKYISQLSVVGATKKQLFAIFLIESFILAFLGAILGSLIASGIFYGLLKVTLSSAITFHISFAKLFLSAIIGIIVSIFASLLPLFKSLKGTVRENEILKENKSTLSKIMPILFLIVNIILIIIEFTIPSSKGILSIINVILSIITFGLCLNYILQIGAKVSCKIQIPTIKIGALALKREKRFSKSFVTLTVGMLVSMLLFMAYNITTSVFNSYLNDFKNMVFVSNVQSSIDTNEFKEIDGVEKATTLIWKTGKIKSPKIEEKTMNIIGTKNALDIIDFEYITDKNKIYQNLKSDKNYVFIDFALKELYGVNVGDKIDLKLDDKISQFEVGGILKNDLLSGNYLVINEDIIKKDYDISVDTVLAIVNGDSDKIVNQMRLTYANDNYYVIRVLDAYKWERESLDSVFDLIGTLAVVITLFIFITLIAGVVVSRSTASGERSTLLCAGMSKSQLLQTEIFEHVLMSVLAFISSFIVSSILTASFINALRLFGLYFEFMYSPWVVAVVGLCIALAYSFLPIALRFKKRYIIRKG